MDNFQELFPVAPLLISRTQVGEIGKLERKNVYRLNVERAKGVNVMPWITTFGGVEEDVQPRENVMAVAKL